MNNFSTKEKHHRKWAAGNSPPADTSARQVLYLLSGGILLAAVFASSFYNYLLFHSLAEGFAIVIACGVFMVAWNTRHFTESHFLLLIGIAYLFVGMLDVAHTLSYAGMNIMPAYAPNAPTQLWIAARYMESLTLLAIPLMLRKSFNPDICLLAYGAVTASVILSVFVWRNFPDCYLPVTGLTPFKIVSEYIICLILVAAGLLFLRRRDQFEPGFLGYTLASIIFTIFSELAFTTYASVFGFTNILGHIFKIISYYLIYKAIIQTSLIRPYDLLFRNLNRQHNHLQTTMNSIGDGVITTDAEGLITFVNPVAESLTGWSSDEAEDKSAAEVLAFVDEQSHEPIDNPLQKVLETGSVAGPARHSLLVHRSGRKVAIDNSGAPIVDQDGKYHGIVLSFRDITKRRRAEEALRKSEQRFRSVFEQAAVGIGQVSFHDASWMEVNDTFCNMLGYSRQELQRTPWPEITHPDDVDLDLIPFRRMSAGELESYSVEKRFIHRKGHEVWARLTLSLVRDIQGQPDYEIAVIENITERKETEEALRASEEKFKKAFHVSPTFLFISELATGILIEVNDAYCTLTGWTRDELIGHTSIERGIVTNAMRRQFVAQVQSRGRIEMMESSVRTRAGDDRPCLFSAERIRYLGRQCLVCSGVDLTERKQAEEKLAAANRELQAFSYSVSHDLRAPLRSIHGFGSLLHEKYGTVLDDTGRDYLQHVVSGADRMQAIIDNLLMLSRISHQELVRRKLDIGAMAAEIIEELQTEEEERSIDLRIHDCPMVSGDAHLVRIALANLLGNAWKYTGKTARTVIELGCTQHNDETLFFVRDNGAGFPAERAEEIFTPFRRLHAESEFPGTGIGLATVQRIIARHGGRIWAESRPGGGATFYFTLGRG